MMMMPDKKSAAGVIVAKISPGKKMEETIEEVSPQSDYEMAKEDAAKKMMEAFEKKDAKMLAMYLQDFMDMCEESSEKEEE
jgi:hypothetical protein